MNYRSLICEYCVIFTLPILASSAKKLDILILRRDGRAQCSAPEITGPNKLRIPVDFIYIWLQRNFYIFHPIYLYCTATQTTGLVQ